MAREKDPHLGVGQPEFCLPGLWLVMWRDLAHRRNSGCVLQEALLECLRHAQSSSLLSRCSMHGGASGSPRLPYMLTVRPGAFLSWEVIALMAGQVPAGRPRHYLNISAQYIHRERYSQHADSQTRS